MAKTPQSNPLLVITGPTATGKTRLAVKVASETGAHIISADSRQVFRKMDIGTGKDLNDYVINNISIPYHLVDIAEPGTEYSVFNFQQDFLSIYNSLTNNNLPIILCGGTGLYIESVIKAYRLEHIPENPLLRSELQQKSMNELIAIFSHFRVPHATTDTIERNRLIRAIEIEKFKAENPEKNPFPKIESLIYAIQLPREIVRERITLRMEYRLQNGMIEETQNLLNQGVNPEQLIKYGLEYKYITLYLQNKLSFEEMKRLLNIAIHQFSKRQMTWFRKMEREGIPIHWIDGQIPLEESSAQIIAKWLRK